MPAANILIINWSVIILKRKCESFDFLSLLCDNKLSVFGCGQNKTFWDIIFIIAQLICSLKIIRKMKTKPALSFSRSQWTVVSPRADLRRFGSTPCGRRGRTQRLSPLRSTACTTGPLGASAVAPAGPGSAGSCRSPAPRPAGRLGSGSVKERSVRRCRSGTSGPRRQNCRGRAVHGHTLPWRYVGCRRHTSCPGWCFHWGKETLGDPWSLCCTASSPR